MLFSHLSWPDKWFCLFLIRFDDVGVPLKLIFFFPFDGCKPHVQFKYYFSFRSTDEDCTFNEMSDECKCLFHGFEVSPWLPATVPRDLSRRSMSFMKMLLQYILVQTLSTRLWLFACCVENCMNNCNRMLLKFSS